MLDFDSIVVGAGISGMTASIYLKRANKNVLLIEKNIPGGQINRSSEVANYPGFKMIDGPTLSMTIYEQVTNLDVKYNCEDVLKITKCKNIFTVKTTNNEYHSKTVIVASGRKNRELGLENEKQLLGRGVSYCALCDGMFFKDKEVGVVGGGNSALEEALYLSNICTKVYIINRSDHLRAEKSLIGKVMNKGNIVVNHNSKIMKLVESENKLSSVILENNSIINIEGLFIYIGSEPDISFLKEMNIELENNYIVVSQDMRTNIDGLYACGDVIKKDIYQLATAVGEGATAGSNAIKYINNKR